MGYYNINKTGFQLVTAATSQPVTTEEIKNYLKIDNDDEDVLLETFIAAATKAAENYTGQALITQTRKFQLDWLPDGEYSKYSLANMPFNGQGSSSRMPFFPYDNYIDLPYKPIQSVTSVVFTDSSNTSTTFSASNYFVDTVTGRLILKDSASWEVDLRSRASVAVTYVCGYGNASTDVPADIKMALWQHIADMYNCRSLCEMSCGCKGLLQSYKDYNEYTV
jgi:hypothetical protein